MNRQSEALQFGMTPRVETESPTRRLLGVGTRRPGRRTTPGAIDHCRCWITCRVQSGGEPVARHQGDGTALMLTDDIDQAPAIVRCNALR